MHRQLIWTNIQRRTHIIRIKYKLSYVRLSETNCSCKTESWTFVEHILILAAVPDGRSTTGLVRATDVNASTKSAVHEFIRNSIGLPPHRSVSVLSNGAGWDEGVL